MHPVTEEDMVFVDRLPEDLQAALDGLADRSMGRTEYGEQVFESLRAAEVGGEV